MFMLQVMGMQKGASSLYLFIKPLVVAALLHFELLPLEMMHRVVIQAMDGNFTPVCLHQNLHLIKWCAGENAAAYGSHLNHILSAARRVVFKGLNAGFAHLSATALAEVTVHRITQPGLQSSAAVFLQPQAS